MFDAFKRVCKNVKEIDGNKILQEVLSGTEIQSNIIELNQRQMYDDGIDSQGKPMGEYAPVTIYYWKPLAAAEGRDGRSDHVTLIDTGAFYDSMKVRSEATQFIISGDMLKPDQDLYSKWPWALGLTRNNLAKIAVQILPEYRRKVLQQILK